MRLLPVGYGVICRPTRSRDPLRQPRLHFWRAALFTLQCRQSSLTFGALRSQTWQAYVQPKPSKLAQQAHLQRRRKPRYLPKLASYCCQASQQHGASESGEDEKHALASGWQSSSYRHRPWRFSLVVSCLVLQVSHTR